MTANETVPSLWLTTRQMFGSLVLPTSHNPEAPMSALAEVPFALLAEPGGPEQSNALRVLGTASAALAVDGLAQALGPLAVTLGALGVIMVVLVATGATR